MRCFETNQWFVNNWLSRIINRPNEAKNIWLAKRTTKRELKYVLDETKWETRTKNIFTQKRNRFRRFFLWSKHSPPRDTYPKTKISQKQKNFFGKIALNFYQKISKTKGNSFEQKIPPGIRTPDLSKNKGNSFEQKIPPPAYVPQICQKTKTIPLNKKSAAPPAYAPQICRLLLLICQRKFMQKIWKFSLKKFFLKKNLFLGYEKRGFFLGGGKFPGKNV